MTTTGPAKITVFTFKDGLLARLAHDLQLTLGRFEVVRTGTAVRGSFWPASLTVDGAMGRGGVVDTQTLSAADRRKIADNIAQSVLKLEQFPEASFVGEVEAGARAVAGTLTLAGRSAPLRVELRAQEGRLRGEVTLVPSRWGVAPYRALAGAIKLQDRVLVRVDLPEQPDEGGRWGAG